MSVILHLRFTNGKQESTEHANVDKAAAHFLEVEDKVLEHSIEFVDEPRAATRTHTES